MKAITVRQPWASLIVAAAKDIENRTWSTRYRGPLLIHAASAAARPAAWQEARALCARLGIPLPTDLPRGGVIGVADLVDCVIDHESPWFEGPFGFVLARARALPFAPCAGALSLWTPLNGKSLIHVA